MKKEITNVYVHFYGTKKGKRKVDFQSELIYQLDGNVLLSPEQFTDYERQAWSKIDSLSYKNSTKGSLVVVHGHEQGGMVIIQILPKQNLSILRGT